MEQHKRIELCRICHGRLERKGDDWGDLCPECADAVSSLLDETGLGEEQVDRVIRFARSTRAHTKRPPQMLVRVPTYYASGYPNAVEDGLIPEFGKPFVPILAHRADGLRIILGSREILDADVPDIQIERRPNGWALFLHPLGGSDPSGYVYFTDDGRSYLVPEQGATPTIEFCRWEDASKEVDRKQRSSTGHAAGLGVLAAMKTPRR